MNQLCPPLSLHLTSATFVEPEKLSKISQVLEKSQENFAVQLTLSFSKQFVSKSM